MLDSISNIVDAIASNLMDLMPFVIIRQYERGVRYTMGVRPKELLPGFSLRLYIYHSVERVVVADDVLVTPIQSVITKDEKLVCFRASIGFRVIDPVRHVNEVMDFEASTTALAQRHLAKRVREKSLGELTAGLKDLEDSLRGTLTTRFRDWGTEVFDVGFVDFAEVPQQIRIFSDPGVHASPIPLDKT